MDPIIAPAAGGPPPPPPPPAPAAPVVVGGTNPAPAPAMQSGGMVGFFRGVNWVEVAFMAAGMAAYFFMVKYYRQKIQSDKVTLKKLKDSVDSLALDVEAMKAKTQKKRQVI